MPPKKKGKAPKKTKEELEEERRLQDEEEARRRAEEEKRLEEERKRREAEEAKRREEEAKNRAAELERLDGEHEATRLDLEGKAQRLAEILRTQKEACDWEKYLACEPRPDAQVEGDMNSFLNSWLLEVSTDLQEVAVSCDSANQVINDLLYVGANARATNDAALDEQCTTFIDKIQAIVDDKIDHATAHILQYADEYTDTNSRSEVKMASASDWIKLGLWINLIAKGSRNKRIDFSELGISVDLPKAIVLQSLALRVTYLPFDQLSRLNPQNIDFALGGILTLDLLAIPPPPKRARGWMIREVPDAADRIKKLHYPLDGMVASAAMPVKVSLQMPAHIIYTSTPRVGWWDPQTQSWEEDGITEIQWNAETNMLNFNTMHVTHLAVLQQRDLNYHKHSWRLQMSTKQPNMARLQLKTEHFESIRFEITDAGCRLVSPQLLQLKSLNNEWFAPGELLMRLTASGIGLCPGLEDDMRFSHLPKLKTLEDRMIQEVVSIVSAYQVSIGNLVLDSPSGGIKWLSAVESSKQVVFAVQEIFWPYIENDIDASSRPTTTNGEVGGGQDNNEALRRHPASGSEVNVLTEVDEEASGGGVKFRIDQSEDPYDTHVHLKLALDEISSPDARDRMENSNVLFEFVLMKMLALLRLFSYSKPLSTGLHGLRDGLTSGGDERELSDDVMGNEGDTKPVENGKDVNGISTENGSPKVDEVAGAETAIQSEPVM
ncbi:hypothetical protein Poli38472_013552 [Pythium oligandrum]|uniref:IC97/Casc1 N-terminal domain-containing protein n=1 Tax=Pythium oligandrum TaxID=41045 RepID=A0A8K1FGT4_PYTOL|nr:hypothetical protein Poli38472_013552 [Pythium oligandrum]|eukprot:TMW58078.1 hypothetical protein Poli38472_013552 [Pythium oligandrum]